ncbi:oncoprotein-induced transcript 3 protein-like isoform X2 [Rhopilema esculentum]
MRKLFFFFLLTGPLNLVAASENCKCSRKACRVPANCTHGLVWDHCYCCRVCAKHEGQICGGKNYVNGECGRNLECIVRYTGRYLNRFQEKPSHLTGRCEPYSCLFEKCPFGQRCFVQDNYTHCDCNISCMGMLEQAVCGETDGKYYKNECELRKEECRIGRRIGVSISPCPGSKIAQIFCQPLEMKLEVVRKIFGRRRPSRLVLNDPSCKAVVNRTHVTVSTFLNSCGTKAKYTTSSVIYSNTLRTLPPRNSLISRGKKVKIPFHCEYSLRERTQNRVRFTQVRPPIDISVEPRKYTKSLGGGIFVEVDTTKNYTVMLRTVKYRGLNVKLIPTHCYATSIQRSLRLTRFVIIDKGCPTEANVAIKSVSNTTIILQIPGIRFKRSRKSGSYVRCRIEVCFLNSGEGLSECQTKCRPTQPVTRKRRSLNTSLNNRQLMHFVGLTLLNRKSLFIPSRKRS